MGGAVSPFSPRYTRDLDDRDVTFLEAQMFLGAEMFLVEMAEGGQVWGLREGNRVSVLPLPLQNQKVHSGTRGVSLLTELWAGRVPLHSTACVTHPSDF